MTHSLSHIRSVVGLSLTLQVCLLLVVMSSSFPSHTYGQDRETMVGICRQLANRTAIRGSTISIGILNQGDLGFPMSNWGGVFLDMLGDYLSPFGCSTQMTLLPFNQLLNATKQGQFDYLFCNPLQTAQFGVQFSTHPLVSFTARFTPTVYNPFPPAKTIPLDRLGGVFLYLTADHSPYQLPSPSTQLSNLTVSDTVLARRAYVASKNLQTFDDVVQFILGEPPLTVTICAVSVNSLGGWQSSYYELFQRGLLRKVHFNNIFISAQPDVVGALVNGRCDFASVRTGVIEQMMKDGVLDESTLVVINNHPSIALPLHISTPLYPEWSFSAVPTMPESLNQAMTVPLLGLTIMDTSIRRAVNNASFSYPFSYDQVTHLMLDLDAIGDGSCLPGYARSQNKSASVNSTDYHRCMKCPTGSYNSHGFGDCLSCPVETYADTIGSIACQPCPLGFRALEVGTSVCYRVPEPISAGIFSLSIALTVIGFICILSFAILLFIFKSHAVFRASSPVFLAVILLGTAIGYASIILLTLDSSQLSTTTLSAICPVQTYLLGISFMLVFGSLAVRSWRILMIFNNKLEVRIITDWDLLVKVGLLTGGELLFDIIWQSVEPLHYEMSVAGEIAFDRCTSNHLSIWFGVYTGLKTILLLLVVGLAIRSRNIALDAFNESKSLVFCSYNLSLVIIITLPLSLVLTNQGSVNGAALIRMIGIFFASTMTLLTCFGPKLLVVLESYHQRGLGQIGATGRTRMTNAGQSKDRTSSEGATQPGTFTSSPRHGSTTSLTPVTTGSGTPGQVSTVPTPSFPKTTKPLRPTSGLDSASVGARKSSLTSTPIPVPSSPSSLYHASPVTPSSMKPISPSHTSFITHPNSPRSGIRLHVRIDRHTNHETIQLVETIAQRLEAATNKP